MRNLKRVPSLTLHACIRDSVHGRTVSSPLSQTPVYADQLFCA